MKDIKIVIGSNFGDEGKGMMTDYFSSSPNSIVVCCNGGAQRGHTVVTLEGIRHVFHHFGSGTFNDAGTYLSEDFIVNPMLFKQEYDDLKRLRVTPKVYINHNCRVTTPWDMMANQIIEESRGKDKHGSCGIGIFETIKRYESGCVDLNHDIRKYYEEKFKKNGILLSDKWKLLFYDNGIWEHWLDDLDFMNDNSDSISDEYFLNLFDNIIFEMGQGLILDQNNTKYFPHLTPSNTGIKNPKKIIENVNWVDDVHIETCYVSRTYMTRHGAGEFPTECKKSDINKHMYDKTNVPNPFQDTLRYGILNLYELHKRCEKDIGYFGDKKSIAITHMNECDIDIGLLNGLFWDWNIYFSDGETRKDIERM